MVVEVAEELVFGLASLCDFGPHEVHELAFAVFDGEIFYRWGGFFSGPGGLPGRSVPVQPGARGCDPLAEPGSGVGEVPVPTNRG